MNTSDFINRIDQILKFHDLSASVFADTIGVQRSSISHLLAGRNKPSLEFVLKVVASFPDVDLYWLLFGKGLFLRRPRPPLTYRQSRKWLSTVRYPVTPSHGMGT